MYSPALVSASTVTVPSSLTVSGPVLVEVITTSAGLTFTPFNVSFSRTFTLGTTAAPSFPFTGVATTSSTASIVAAITVTVTVAVSQLSGFNTSQIVY